MDISDIKVNAPGVTQEQATAIMETLRNLYCICTGTTTEQSMAHLVALVKQRIPMATDDAVLAQVFSIAAGQLVAMIKQTADNMNATANDPTQMDKIVETLKQQYAQAGDVTQNIS